MTASHGVIPDLTKMAGWERTPIGFRCKPIADGAAFLDIHTMMFGNRRLILSSPDPWPAAWPLRAWCYRGPHAFLLAAIAACAWPDDDPDWTPDGWYKNPMTDEKRPEWFETDYDATMALAVRYGLVLHYKTPAQDGGSR